MAKTSSTIVWVLLAVDDTGCSKEGGMRICELQEMLIMARRCSAISDGVTIWVDIMDGETSLLLALECCRRLLPPLLLLVVVMLLLLRRLVLLLVLLVTSLSLCWKESFVMIKRLDGMKKLMCVPVGITR